MKDPNVEPWRPDWTSVSEAAVYQLLQEAKEHLQGTIELGINADQRSAALCGVFGAGAFALFAVSATVFAGDHRSDILQWAAVIEGFVLLIASLLCAWAAGPGDFYVSGYEPRLLIASAADTLWMQRYIIEDIQRRIEANRAEIIREDHSGTGYLCCWSRFSFAPGADYPPFFSGRLGAGRGGGGRVACDEGGCLWSVAMMCSPHYGGA
jgi:hypothetical protein